MGIQGMPPGGGLPNPNQPPQQAPQQGGPGQMIQQLLQMLLQNRQQPGMPGMGAPGQAGQIPPGPGNIDPGFNLPGQIPGMPGINNIDPGFNMPPGQIPGMPGNPDPNLPIPENPFHPKPQPIPGSPISAQPMKAQLAPPQYGGVAADKLGTGNPPGYESNKAMDKDTLKTEWWDWVAALPPDQQGPAKKILEKNIGR